MTAEGYAECPVCGRGILTTYDSLIPHSESGERDAAWDCPGSGQRVAVKKLALQSRIRVSEIPESQTAHLSAAEQFISLHDELEAVLAKMRECRQAQIAARDFYATRALDCTIRTMRECLNIMGGLMKKRGVT